MKFIAGFEKIAVSTKKMTSALMERIRTTTTDPVQRLMLHPKNPLRGHFHKKLLSEVNGGLKASRRVLRQQPDYDSEIDYAHAIKRDMVGAWQKIHPKGSLDSPQQKMENASKLKRQSLFSGGEKAREVSRQIEKRMKK